MNRLYYAGLDREPALRFGSALSETTSALPLLAIGLLIVGSLALSKRKPGFGR